MLGTKPLVFLVNLIVGVVETILSLRLILKLFGANPQAPFVTWVYETSAPLLQPFANIFPSPQIEGLFILEFSTLFALGIYAFIGYFAVELVAALDRPLIKGKK
jgi:uncharacterized protein YggT (Ycf19 family)